MLKDSEMMVPRTRKSLEDAYQALEDLVVSFGLSQGRDDSITDHGGSSPVSLIPPPFNLLALCRTSLQTALRSDTEMSETQQWKDAFSQLQQVETARQSDGN